MNSYHVIKGCKDSSNSTCSSEWTVLRSMQAKPGWGDTAVLALSHDAGLEQGFTNIAPHSGAKRAEEGSSNLENGIDVYVEDCPWRLCSSCVWMFLCPL